MRSFLSALLSASLLLEGCFSSVSLNDEILPIDEPAHWADLYRQEIRVVLDDGTEFTSRAYEHMEVPEPAHAIIGSGLSGKRSSGDTHPFTGIIPWSSVDSMMEFGSGSDLIHRFVLSDSTIVTFRPSEYHVITPDSGTGIWLLGERDGDQFVGMIPPGRITQIEGPNRTVLLTSRLERLRAFDGRDLEITLRYGSEVRSNGESHIAVPGTSHFIIGRGSNRQGHAKQIIHWSSIDSARDAASSDGPLLRCWLTDRSTMDFREGEYLIVTPDSGSGFWLCGTMNGRPYLGRIDPGTIKSIGTTRISYLKTFFCSLGVFVFVAAMAIDANGGFMGSH